MATTSEVKDEFGEKINQSDIKLVVEDHRIPVSKSVLCIASPVFRAMLDGDFQEKSKDEISLPGKDYEHFVEFLRCIYPDKLKKVTVKNAYQLLPLAHEYQVQKIQHRCEKVIGSIVRKNHAENVMELYRHIEMSETYALDNLKKICMNMVSEHKLAEFEKAREKYPISDDSHVQVIKIALRKRELTCEDEEKFYLTLNGNNVGRLEGRKKGKTPDLPNFQFGQAVTETFSSALNATTTLTLTGSVSTCNFEPKDSLRALRLTKRFNITQNNFPLRIMENLKQQIEDLPEDLKEELKLIPEDVKQIMEELS